jgi:hypothetical protein
MKFLMIRGLNVCVCGSLTGIATITKDKVTKLISMRIVVEDIVVFMSFVKKYVTAEILIVNCLTQYQYHNCGILDCRILQAQEVMPMCISARRCSK